MGADALGGAGPHLIGGKLTGARAGQASGARRFPTSGVSLLYHPAEKHGAAGLTARREIGVWGRFWPDPVSNRTILRARPSSPVEAGSRARRPGPLFAVKVDRRGYPSSPGRAYLSSRRWFFSRFPIGRNSLVL